MFGEEDYTDKSRRIISSLDFSSLQEKKLKI